MRRCLVVLSLVAVALAAAGPAGAKAFSQTDSFFTTDDGVQLAVSYYEPTDVARPAAGFPAVMVFHGLGGSRTSVAPVAETFAANGYAVLTFDQRAHGLSGGFFSLDGPREVKDVGELYTQLLAARPGIDAAHIGAWGLSLGGGALWAAKAAGIPFAAIEPMITWTDLYGALVPQGLVKTGAVFQFSNSVVGKIDPALAPFLPDLLSNRNLEPIKQIFDARSVRGSLSTITTPTFLLQGRTDYAFDIDQAAAAYRALPGPKRLYIGDLGHAPAKDPVAEQPYYLDECVQWFDRFLKGIPNGIDMRLPVEVAADPWNGTTKSFSSLPPVATMTVPFKGRSTMRGDGKIVRTAKIRFARRETFGAPVVRATVTGSFTHVVAVLTAGGTIVSEGGTALTPSTKPHTISIKLISTAVAIPRNARLTLTLAAASTAQNPANLLYLITLPSTQRLTVRNVTVRLPLLKTRISP
ncbi:MAG: type transport system ATP-binding protein [Gaiellaceae bacterium]|nr:type transport system ATP-binding protein [Gaiellaceae bacterium]